MTPRTVDDEIARVLASDTCSGCGACCVIDRGLRMELDDRGYLRPQRVADSDERGRAERVRQFRRSCPALVVRAGSAAGATRHPTLGPYLGVWAAWAIDETLRHAGSSGGVLTALAAWMAESGSTDQVVVSRADPSEPRRTLPIVAVTSGQAAASAGSRYAPAAVAALPQAHDPRSVVVTKPCEAAAVRARSEAMDSPAPILLSFFCAGTPSQQATEHVLRSIGVPEQTRLRDLRYRGQGWPGRFTAVGDDHEWSTSYEESWGRHLGPAIQWRCKLCPDGVGESADIAACDWWETDHRGYPIFAEGEGRSGLIARTQRGLELIERAVSEGVIGVIPIDADAVMQVQPFQETRRRSLFGRLLGARAAGRRIPRFVGFHLGGLALRQPITTLRAAKGTWHRTRALRATRHEDGRS